MAETSISLLDQLCATTDTKSPSWQRFAEIYTPLLHAWMRRYQLQPGDADDLVQEVLLVVSKELPQFRHSGRTGALRAWLRTIMVHRLRNFWRAGQNGPVARGGSEALGQLDQLSDPHSSLSRLWDRQHDQHVTRELLRLIQADFAPNTWQAFWRVVLDEAEPDTVAAELGISLNAVFIAKSRVLNRLREVGRGFIE
jgi:RNA polymerase sigma-70 factor (ECF subfamily)